MISYEHICKFYKNKMSANRAYKTYYIHQEVDKSWSFHLLIFKVNVYI